MRKDLLTHFAFFLTSFVLISLGRKWLSLDFVPFWLGGALGTFLPYLDNLIYIYLLRPDEKISQKAVEYINEKKVNVSLDLLVSTRAQREDLIFHSVYFQVVFAVFTFLVISSSGNLFGRGIVLAFFLHLLISQVMDYVENKNLNSWFRKVSVTFDQGQTRLYLLANFIIFLLLAFVF